VNAMTKTTDGRANLATIMCDHPAWTTTARGAAFPSQVTYSTSFGLTRGAF
jgi:hypothetical protein